MASASALPAPVTPAWLTSALRQSGVLADAAVAAFDTLPLAAGDGYMAALFRLTPHYTAAAPAAPASLVLKVPAAFPGARSIGTKLGLYEREVRFYRDLA